MKLQNYTEIYTTYPQYISKKYPFVILCINEIDTYKESFSESLGWNHLMIGDKCYHTKFKLDFYLNILKIDCIIRSHKFKAFFKHS